VFVSLGLAGGQLVEGEAAAALGAAGFAQAGQVVAADGAEDRGGVSLDILAMRSGGVSRQRGTVPRGTKGDGSRYLPENAKLFRSAVPEEGVNDGGLYEL
jgi:hypothetical protein